MRIARRASALLCSPLLLIAGLMSPPQTLAQPAFTHCDDWSGPAAGLCQAAAAMGCAPGYSGGACSTLAARFEHIAGELAPWLDREGPAITCADPIDGAILDQVPGTVVSFQGSVTDASGLSQLLVNGAAVAVGASGEFSADIVGSWGMNFVELSASDGVGNQSTRTCTFLLSDTWVQDGEILASSISFKARQAVFDDGNRSGPLNSLADIFHTVLNSSGLSNELHASLLAVNPLKPDACDEYVLGICVLRSEVLYLNRSTPGPNTTALTLVSGGVYSDSRVENIGIRVRVRGHVAGIPYDTTGWITFDYATTRFISDVRLSGGQPTASLRPGTIAVTVGGIETSFSGLDGAIINIVVDLFNGTVRDLVRGVVVDFLTSNVNDILGDVFGSLDVHNLAAAFSVPLLDDASTLGVDFDTALSTLNVSSNRMLASIGTRFQATPAHARPSLGAPVPPGSRVLDATGSRPLAIAIHDGLINQVLHALWRGGYFDASLVGADLGGLIPPDVSLQLAATLPPAAHLRDDGRLEIAIGAALVHVDYPSLLPAPIEPSVSARGSCTPSLLGDDLMLDQCLVEELHLSLGSEGLDATTLASLELFLTDTINQVLLTVANDSLPVLPIPGVLLPSSLWQFGLPGGSEMGLTNPQLNTVSHHTVLDGGFGVR